MKLLYADLPERPSPEDPGRDRGRVELLIGGAVALLGVAVAGSAVVADLARKHAGNPEAALGGATPETTPTIFTGVERSVGPSTAPTAPSVDVGLVAELEFAIPVDVASIEASDDPEMLPGPGSSTRLVSPRMTEAPAVAELPPPPTSTVPSTSTVPTTSTVPSTSTVPTTSTLPPTSTVPTTSTVPSTSTVPTTRAVPAGPEVLALASATGFVATPAMAETIAREGLAGWVEWQLRPGEIADRAVEEALGDFVLLDAAPAQLRDPATAAQAHAQTRWAAFTRSYISERQVEEAIVGLWRELFAVAAKSAFAVTHDQIVRAGALGPYADLLVAVAQSPAVLHSTAAGRVDANAPRPVSTSFARLVAEEYGGAVLAVAEVRSVARVLSGWSTVAGEFHFDDSRHAATPESLAGWSTPGHRGQAGLDDGENLLRHLATQPATARRVATMVARRLVGRGAQRELVDRAARAYLAESTSIAAVVRVVLNDSAAMTDVSAGQTGRRGDEWVVCALRALGAAVDISRPWDGARQGSVPGELHHVGADQRRALNRAFVDDTDWWVAPSAIADRWAAARRLVEPSDGAGFTVDLKPFAPSEQIRSVDYVVGLARQVGGTVLAATERDALLVYLGNEPAELLDPDLDRSVLADLVALILSFPSFMRRDGGVS